MLPNGELLFHVIPPLLPLEENVRLGLNVHEFEWRNQIIFMKNHAYQAMETKIMLIE